MEKMEHTKVLEVDERWWELALSCTKVVGGSRNPKEFDDFLEFASVFPLVVAFPKLAIKQRLHLGIICSDNLENKTKVINEYEQHEAQSVQDIGCGIGCEGHWIHKARI